MRATRNEIKFGCVAGRGSAIAVVTYRNLALAQYASRRGILILCSVCAAIKNPVSCEVWSMIWFLLLKTLS